MNLLVDRGFAAAACAGDGGRTRSGIISTDMKKKLWACWTWFRAKKMNLAFGTLFAICAAGIALCLCRVFCLKPSDAVPLLAGILPAAIVWWQGYLIQQQMQLQAIIELNKEWNCREMLENRTAAWNDLKEANKYKVEPVLEFLEKVSTFQKNGVISVDLIWDTFGWYVWRYYFYCSKVIEDLRRDWTPNHPDATLYCDLQDLWKKLLACEVKKRNLAESQVLDELALTKEKFIASERRLLVRD